MATLGQHPDKLFVSLQQAVDREVVLRDAWLSRNGGYGRAQRPHCTCGAVAATAMQGSVRAFFCPHAGTRDPVTKAFWVGKNGERPSCYFRRTTPVVYLPGHEPKPKRKRAARDNGVAAYPCFAAKCVTRACPCFASCASGEAHTSPRTCTPSCASPKGEMRDSRVPVFRGEEALRGGLHALEQEREEGAVHECTETVILILIV